MNENDFDISGIDQIPDDGEELAIEDDAINLDAVYEDGGDGDDEDDGTGENADEAPNTPIIWSDEEIQQRIKAKVGIVNCGNTCYMNAAIQCLSHVPLVAVYFATKQYLPLDQTNDVIKPHVELIHQWQDIMDVLWSKDNTVSGVRPGGFLSKFRQCAVKDNMEWMAGLMQNDSQEFMLFLIECLHKAVRKPNDEITKLASLEIDDVPNIMSLDETHRKVHTSRLALKNWGIHFKDGVSVITDNFYGQFISVIYSEETNEKSVSFEPFSCVNIPVPQTDPGTLTLYDCFDETYSIDKLEGDCAWNSPTQNRKVSASKTMRIWKTPTVLIITLKRFTYTGQKLNAQIDYPIEDFDISRWCLGPKADDCK